MEITLNEKDIKTFKTFIKDDNDHDYNLIIDTKYDSIYTLLNNIPKVLLHIICNYATEQYNIKCTIDNAYGEKYIDETDELIVDPASIFKTSDVVFTNIKNEYTDISLNIIIHYNLTLFTFEYEYTIDYEEDTHNADIKVLTMQESTTHLELDNITYVEDFSYILVFVINKLIDIIIDEDTSIINDEYLKLRSV